MAGKLLTVKHVIKFIPKDALICVTHKGIKVIEDGGTVKLLKSEKSIHSREIVTLVQDEIKGQVYVDIEVM